MTIHTFGDSHSNFPVKNVRTHHLGPRLCNSIGRDGISIKTGFDVNEGDTVIFCFGEIDCRCHIHRFAEDSDYKSVIDFVVVKYFKKISIAVNEITNLKVAIYNVVPTVQKNTVREHPMYPFIGSDEERKKYVLYFNEKLKEKCLEYNYIFFDVYDKYTDENGFLNKSLSDGTLHIGNGKYISEFIDKYGLK